MQNWISELYNVVLLLLWISNLNLLWHGPAHYFCTFCEAFALFCSIRTIYLNQKECTFGKSRKWHFVLWIKIRCKLSDVSIVSIFCYLNFRQTWQYLGNKTKDKHFHYNCQKATCNSYSFNHITDRPQFWQTEHTMYNSGHNSWR